MKRASLLIMFLIVCVWTSRAQNERKFIRQGNKYFEEAMKEKSKPDTTQFNKAEIEYRKALEKKPEDTKWQFNLADALYKQMKFDDSAEKFKTIADHTANKVEKSRAFYNQGNSLLMNKKLDESIAAYKEALRNNPKDLEAKYNLLYAMNMKKKQQDQKKKQDQNKKNQDKDKKDQNKDKDKNKDKKDQKKDQNKDQQNKNQDQQKQQQQKQQQQQQQGKISRQNAEQMLQALENNEKQIQEKVKKVQALKAQSKKVDKDW